MWHKQLRMVFGGGPVSGFAGNKYELPGIVDVCFLVSMARFD